MQKNTAKPRTRKPNLEEYASTLGALGNGAVSTSARRCDHIPTAIPMKLAMKLKSPAAKRINVPNAQPPFMAAPMPNRKPPAITERLGA
jgi:hypothetical protein